MAGSKNSKYFDIFLNYHFWLSTNDNTQILGKKLINILKDIDKGGSIQSAAKNNKISYRKAWGDIKKAEETLKFCITETHRGGKNGGKTILTEDGIKMLIAFDKLEDEFEKAFYKIAKNFFHSLNDNKNNE